jgi:hypothetical protein
VVTTAGRLENRAHVAAGWHIVQAQLHWSMRPIASKDPGAEVDHQPGATPESKSVACKGQRIAWRRRP